MAGFRFACHLIQFGKEAREHPEQVLRDVAEAGWDGVEGLSVSNADELVEMAVLARRYGLHLVNQQGGQPGGIDAVRFAATLGNDAVEVPACWRRDFGGDNPTDEDFERAARSLDEVLSFARQLHIKGFHHSHMRTMIETLEDAERLMTAAPDLWLLYDTGHLLACGSDPMGVFDSEILRHRIGHVHLKDFHADDPATWNHRTCKYGQVGRFAELGQGNFGLDVGAVLEGLQKVGYQGWISVELDAPYPPKPAAEAARANRAYLRSLGY
ncbi:MAG: sugar phosphate isomerase/epimerase [Chloroflexi bacterium]|nr:sugar phosphate isomerase/epimerase [Chloroflexota bacterium]